MPEHNSRALKNQATDEADQYRDVANSTDWFYGTEELLDALPRLWTRSLLYFLIAFTVLALPWAMLSKVDETGTARGRVEPKGATQRLDSQVGGSVKSVKVKEGDNVNPGQVLIELDAQVLKTDLQQVEKRWEGFQSRLAQLELVRNQLMLAINVQEQQNESREWEKTAQVNQAQQFLDTNLSNYNSAQVERQALVDKARQNLASSQTTNQLAKSRLNRDIAEIERYKQLLQEGAIPQTKVVELQKEAEESQQAQQKAQADIIQAQLQVKEEESRYKSVINQAHDNIKQAKLRLKEQQSSYQSLLKAGKLALLNNQTQLKSLDTQLSEVRSQIAQSRSQITSLKLQLQQRIIRSPVKGVIFELPIAKPGAVVQPGQKIAQIAPNQSGLVIKAQIPSQQSGFLKVGMPVKIKFDAYPFQNYGIVKGQLNSISPDTKIQETPQGKIESFELEIALDKPYIKTADKRIYLSPGQTATAEVIVRQRRIIDFILDPFKKLQEGGLEL